MVVGLRLVDISHGRRVTALSSRPKAPINQQQWLIFRTLLPAGYIRNARLSITEFFATLRAATLVSVFGTYMFYGGGPASSGRR